VSLRVVSSGEASWLPRWAEKRCRLVTATVGEFWTLSSRVAEVVDVLPGAARLG